MSRFMHHIALRRIETLIQNLESLKDSMIQAEPVAGSNRGTVKDAIDDLIWTLIFLHKVHRTLSTWTKVGPNGGGSVNARLRRSGRFTER